MQLTAGARLGPYEIVSALGAGGMGEVYKARDTRLDRVVAIKILPEQLAADPQFRDRFDREARALDKAHRAGITHRDLKPGSIMLTKAGAKLLDFGLAKARGVGVAQDFSPAVRGSPAEGTRDDPRHVPVRGAGAARWPALSGRYEIYLRPFPEPSGKWQVSTAGGTQPRWRRDGTELYYVAPDTRLMAVPIRLASDTRAVEAGVPVALLPTRLASGAAIVLAGFFSRAQYAVAPDGRFLMNVTADDAVTSPITIVQNWTAGLKK